MFNHSTRKNLHCNKIECIIVSDVIYKVPLSSRHDLAIQDMILYTLFPPCQYIMLKQFVEIWIKNQQDILSLKFWLYTWIISSEAYINVKRIIVTIMK